MSPTDIPDLSQYYPPVPPPPREVTITALLPRVRRRMQDAYGSETTYRREWGIAATTRTEGGSDAEAEAWASTDVAVREANGCGPDYLATVGKYADIRDTEAMRIDMVEAISNYRWQQRFVDSILRKHLAGWLGRFGLTAKATWRKATLVHIAVEEMERQYDAELLRIEEAERERITKIDAAWQNLPF